MKNDVMQIRRPRKKNLLRIAAFAAGEAIITTIFVISRNSVARETFEERLLAAVIFCVFMLGSLLALAYIADSLRNLFGKAAIILTDETFWIFSREDPIGLDQIKKIEIQTEKKERLVVFTENDEIVIPDGLCELPLLTIREAIQNRIDDLSTKEKKKSA